MSNIRTLSYVKSSVFLEITKNKFYPALCITFYVIWTCLQSNDYLSLSKRIEFFQEDTTFC